MLYLLKKKPIEKQGRQLEARSAARHLFNEVPSQQPLCRQEILFRNVSLQYIEASLFRKTYQHFKSFPFVTPAYWVHIICTRETRAKFLT